MPPFLTTRRKVVLVLFAFWLAFAAWYGWLFLKWREYGAFSTTTAQIESVSLQPAPPGHEECQSRHIVGRVEAMVAVVYTFKVKGRSYTSDQLTRRYRGEVECNRADTLTTKRKYEAMKTLTVYYDPADPGRSVVRLPDALVIDLFGPILGAVLLGLIVTFIRKKRTQQGWDTNT